MTAGQGSRGPVGAENSMWIAFAGVMMAIVGSLDVIWGLAAILNDDVVVVGGQGAMILSITAWGWVHLFLGAVVGATGLGLIAGKQEARMAAVFLLALNAVLQIVWFPAAPLWAVLMISLDIVIIYQLLVNWAKA